MLMYLNNVFSKIILRYRKLNNISQNQETNNLKKYFGKNFDNVEVYLVIIDRFKAMVSYISFARYFKIVTFKNAILYLFLR